MENSLSYFIFVIKQKLGGIGVIPQFKFPLRFRVKMRII